MNKAEFHRTAKVPFAKRYENFIGGKWVAPASGKYFENTSPVNGQPIGEVARSDAADIELALDAAHKAKDAWGRTSAAERALVLNRIADRIEENLGLLALAETWDNGKPIRETTAADVPLAVDHFRYFAGVIRAQEGGISEIDHDTVAYHFHEPLGVVGQIIPWNFPLLMATWKLAPALAAGNAVVLKPAEQSPLTALRLAQLASEAGLPKGVLNVVPGFGETAGKALGLHPDVDCIAFTGSTEVGKYFMQYSGQSNLKRVWLECGGKTPVIVMGDCHDLDMAARSAAFGIFYNQGEVCNAGSRLLLHQSIKEPFLEKLLGWAQKLQPGDPLDPKTRMGAIVDEKQMQRILGYIEKGKEQGAQLLTGGQRVREESGGFYIQPTVFDQVNNDMVIAREEIFGPVLSVLTFDQLDQAVNIANDTIYGLAAAIWTRDINVAHRTARALRAGVVWVNCFDTGEMSTPFGVKLH